MKTTEKKKKIIPHLLLHLMHSYLLRRGNLQTDFGIFIYSFYTSH